MQPLRILIADDHPVVRDGLRLALQLLPDAEVVGEARTGLEVVAAAAGLQPEVVVMDLHMPELNGIEATRRIVQDSPNVAVLVLTMFDDDRSLFAAMRAGARGYLLKGADPDQIADAVRAVARGEAVFGPPIANKVLGYFASEQRGFAPPFPELTEREREVLELVAQGLSNSEITRRLVISPKTTSNHISNILAKLHVADRAQAIVRAREAGLGQQRRPTP